jgi:hypothetical protein
MHELGTILRTCNEPADELPLARFFGISCRAFFEQIQRPILHVNAMPPNHLMGEKLDFAYVAEKFMHARNILKNVPNRRNRYPKGWPGTERMRAPASS